jgi:hypothetical protein
MSKYDTAKESVGTAMNEENCRALNLAYKDLTKYSQNIIKQEAGRYNEDKKVVQACLINFGYKFPKLSDVIAYLKQPGADKVEFQIANYDYSKKPSSEGKNKPVFGKVKVENEIVLKNTISENLNKVKTQKNALLIESIIVKDRLIRLVENNEFKTKRDLDSFSMSLLKESAYLNSKGYNENLVSEQWGNILGGLKGFFTGSGFDAMMQYFKEYAVGWLLRTIGLPDTGWIASFVKTAIGNLPLGDIGKLTNCDYTVPFLAKTIVESIIMKFTQSMKIDNAFTSVIRNALVEMGESTTFVQTLESGLRTIVCPIVRQLAGKMGTISNNLAASENPAEMGKQQSSSPSLMSSAQNLMNTAGNMMSSTSNAVNASSRFTD